jgi:hypothetical protein
MPGQVPGDSSSRCQGQLAIRHNGNVLRPVPSGPAKPELVSRSLLCWLTQGGGVRRIVRVTRHGRGVQEHDLALVLLLAGLRSGQPDGGGRSLIGTGIAATIDRYGGFSVPRSECAEGTATTIGGWPSGCINVAGTGELPTDSLQSVTRTARTAAAYRCQASSASLARTVLRNSNAVRRTLEFRLTAHGLVQLEETQALPSQPGEPVVSDLFCRLGGCRLAVCNHGLPLERRRGRAGPGVLGGTRCWSGSSCRFRRWIPKAQSSCGGRVQ